MCRGLDSKEILCRSLWIGIPILVLLVIIAGLLGGSVKDLYPVRKIFCQLIIHTY